MDELEYISEEDEQDNYDYDYFASMDDYYMGLVC